MFASRSPARITPQYALLVSCVLGGPLAGCAQDDPAPARASFALSYDCTTWQDTGYVDGTPFTIDLVTVAGYPVEIHTADALLTMMAAAEQAGIVLELTDGFRTYDEQAYYYDCYLTGACNGGSPASAPGYSNHQSGHAIDFAMGGSAGSWIFANAPSFGWSNDEGASVGEDWHWTWWGGGSPTAYCSNAAPIGALDFADCGGVGGWAFDAEAGAAAVQAHIYFGGPAGVGTGIATTASEPRSDLCSVVGSCDHGFVTGSPLSLFDGASHAVHAYAIDSEGGSNPELANSPRQLQCEAVLPAGVARWVTGPDSYVAWRFDGFFDQLPIAAAVADAIPRGEDLGASPRLVTPAAGGAVFLVAGTTKRHVPDPKVMTAWRFDWNAIQVMSDADLAALDDGPPVRSRPVLVVDSAGRVLLIDDALPADDLDDVDDVPDQGADAGVTGDAGGPGVDEGGDPSGGCAIAHGSRGASGCWLFGLIGAAGYAVRRRRTPPAR